VAKPGQRLRHSPGETRRKKSRGANELERSSNCRARRMPRPIPCADRLHALCQIGEFAETLKAWLTRSVFEEERCANKS